MPDNIWVDLRKAIQSDIQQHPYSAKPESSGRSNMTQMGSVGSASVNVELDGLTGLRTPRAFFRDFERSLNDSNLGVALLVADFDHFKQVNDRRHLRSRAHPATVLISGQASSANQLGGQ